VDSSFSSLEENFQINILKKRGVSNRLIAKVIRNFLKFGQKYGVRSKQRRRGKVNAQQIGRVRHKQAKITCPLLKLLWFNW
jgi:hypothetical protein